jgi:hypothetical protein
MIPVIILVLFLSAVEIPFVKSFACPHCYDQIGSIFSMIFILGMFFLIGFLGFMIIFALSTQIKKFRSSRNQFTMRIMTGILLLMGTVLTLYGSIPFVFHFIYDNLDTWFHWIVSSINVSGIIAILGALFGRKDGNEAHGIRSVLLTVGLSLLSYGILLLLYMAVFTYKEAMVWILPVPCGVSLLLALFSNINHVSMHRFYRNKLMKAYLPTFFMNVDKGDADKYYLADIEQWKEPYHIINAAIHTRDSDDPKLKLRSCDNFIFSPLYSGAGCTRYIKTKDYEGGSMNLATAFSISGAAVNPNTYATNSRPLSFLMALFNVRLGYWIRNPKKSATRFRLLYKPIWYVLMLREMLGKNLNENKGHILLSDGGHFENLGLYELIQRKCKTIIISDSGADPDFTFNNLANVIELVRTDFGANIDLDIRPLIPGGDERISKKAFVFGTVKYSNNSVGDIVYIKTSYIDKLPADIYSYRRNNSAFPDQTTMDQFFDEKQFEAYRELGFRIGKKLCTSTAWKRIEKKWKAIWKSV